MTRLLMILVRTYQLTLAAWFGGRCRFTPSCSAYAIEALRLHGAWRGALLAGGRVARCSPLCAGGHDPVPAPSPRAFVTPGRECAARQTSLVEPDAA